MSRFKVGDAVEVLRSDCGNQGRRGVINGSESVYGIPKWIVAGMFNGHDGSTHPMGLFMDMDLRPLSTGNASEALEAGATS